MSLFAPISNAAHDMAETVVNRVLDVLENRWPLTHISGVGGPSLFSVPTQERIRALRGRLNQCCPDDWRSVGAPQTRPPQKQSRRVPHVQAAQAPAKARRKAALPICDRRKATD